MEVRVIATGLKFPEGPVINSDGSLLVVEVRRGTLTRVHPDGQVEVVSDVGGGPNSAAIGPDGAVYIPNNGGGYIWREEILDMNVPTAEWRPDLYTGGRIERVDLASGEVTVLYTECDGKPLNRPNDLVFDADGNMWFTDTGRDTGREHDLGGLYFAKSDGSFIVEIAHHLWTPNGVGLSPDGSVVYVSETMTSRLWAWDITGVGTVTCDEDGNAKARFIVGLDGFQLFDSLAVEANGSVAVATMVNPGISVISPDGTVEKIAMSDPMTTNICFGGDDMRTAYITESCTGRLVEVTWPRPGLRLNFSI
jgi:gluconolactonase